MAQGDNGLDRLRSSWGSRSSGGNRLLLCGAMTGFRGFFAQGCLDAGSNPGCFAFLFVCLLVIAPAVSEIMVRCKQASMGGKRARRSEFARRARGDVSAQRLRWLPGSQSRNGGTPPGRNDGVLDVIGPIGSFLCR
ncbi:hypothetical protein B0T16DRAFT_399021 [Cercophora newfieldiana]|uniref:Uncharacterized protein n=1 Tax=Cercophora newfieldiana TaxID=92897 RepID=A0AA39YPG3_9PEZI|nr:hypothetical protein B0T16DRAFT_399021 [Cercophora newfieldiana]